MNGTLYVCATPIGNLEDMTFRAARILGEVSVIAAEDTRHTIKLLNHFNIKTPLVSYHKFSEREKSGELIRRLKNGQDVALVSDAGMPAIQDPGEYLVKQCYEHGITVTAVPGATAAVTALVLSGLSTEKFLFEGFLPIKRGERLQALQTLKPFRQTLIFYAAPHHLKKYIADMLEVFGDRDVALARELTKKFEEVKRTSLAEAVSYYDETEPKGEFVIVVAGMSRQELDGEKAESFKRLSIGEHVDELMRRHEYDLKTAMKAAAKERGVSKREIYAAINKD